MTPEAVIHVCAARAFRWRGALGVHTWIATRPQSADIWTRFEVVGFSVARGGRAVHASKGGIPDAYWQGAEPARLREARGGDEVDAPIARLHQAAAAYPYDDAHLR